MRIQISESHTAAGGSRGARGYGHRTRSPPRCSAHAVPSTPRETASGAPVRDQPRWLGGLSLPRTPARAAPLREVERGRCASLACMQEHGWGLEQVQGTGENAAGMHQGSSAAAFQHSFHLTGGWFEAIMTVATPTTCMCTREPLVLCLLVASVCHAHGCGITSKTAHKPSCMSWRMCRQAGVTAMLMPRLSVTP